MGALGIGDDDTVVAYDDAGGVIAARLVWMLRATGHEAALLDGGLAAWDGELEAGAAARRPAAAPAPLRRGRPDVRKPGQDDRGRRPGEGRPHAAPSPRGPGPPTGW